MDQPQDLTLTTADIETENGRRLIDAVRYRGGVWLVPAWLESADGQWLKPARMIRADLLESHQLGDMLYLTTPLPECVLDGRNTGPIEVLEAADIPFAIPKPSGHQN